MDVYPSTATPTQSVESFSDVTSRIIANLSLVVDGKPEALRAALVCLLAEGHLLIEDVPGVGKTTLARALAASIDSEVRRIQFTPDLLPGDVTGVSVFDPAAQRFSFKPGAIFANLVIADEINRASPKTQSALLEAMEEHQVSVDGQTHRLPSPFLVVATQNPVEMEGTYPLPEAQRDRFMMRISMGYPDATAEVEMLRQREREDPIATLGPVATADQVRSLISTARSLFVSPLIEQYTVALAHATRNHPQIRLGASPRATLQLLRAAKVSAALDGREFVVPDDVAALVPAVFTHRLVAVRGLTTARGGANPLPEILGDIVRSVPVPVSAT